MVRRALIPAAAAQHADASVDAASVAPLSPSRSAAARPTSAPAPSSILPSLTTDFLAVTSTEQRHAGQQENAPSFFPTLRSASPHLDLDVVLSTQPLLPTSMLSAPSATVSVAAMGMLMAQSERQAQDSSASGCSSGKNQDGGGKDDRQGEADEAQRQCDPSQALTMQDDAHQSLVTTPVSHISSAGEVEQAAEQRIHPSDRHQPRQQLASTDSSTAEGQGPYSESPSTSDTAVPVPAARSAADQDRKDAWVRRFLQARDHEHGHMATCVSAISFRRPPFHR